MINRILVCGCARSGNTLMLHLLGTGFKHTEVLYDGPGGEVVPTKEHVQENKIIVGKFPKRAVKLSRWLNDESFGVIYMMRDPRDVLVSKHFLKPNKYWVHPKRWIETAKIANKYKDHERIILVKYEDLIKNPDHIQKNISKVFKMEISNPFAECYKRFDRDDSVNMSNMNGARPLDKSRIGNWKSDPEKKEYISDVFRKYPQIVQLMKPYGYY